MAEPPPANNPQSIKGEPSYGDDEIERAFWASVASTQAVQPSSNPSSSSSSIMMQAPQFTSMNIPASAHVPTTSSLWSSILTQDIPYHVQQPYPSYLPPMTPSQYLLEPPATPFIPWQSMDIEVPQFDQHQYGTAVAGGGTCGSGAMDLPHSLVQEEATSNIESVMAAASQAAASDYSYISRSMGSSYGYGGSSTTLIHDPHQHQHHHHHQQQQQHQLHHQGHHHHAKLQPDEPSTSGLGQDHGLKSSSSTGHDQYGSSISAAAAMEEQLPSSSSSPGLLDDPSASIVTATEATSSMDSSSSEDELSIKAAAGGSSSPAILDYQRSSSASDQKAQEASSSDKAEPGKKQTKQPRKKGQKRNRQPRIALVTKSEVEHLEDGFRWRKYGQKAVKNSPYPRSYYRCTNSKCSVKKRVERSSEDPSMVITTYEGQHNHHSPAVLRGAVESQYAAFASTPFSFPPLQMPIQLPRSSYDLAMQLQSQDPLSSSMQPNVSVAPQEYNVTIVEQRASQLTPQLTSGNPKPSESFDLADQGLLEDMLPLGVRKAPQ